MIVSIGFNAVPQAFQIDVTLYKIKTIMAYVVDIKDKHSCAKTT